MTAVSLDRSRSIGGSDVAAILGISPFRTPLDVWREKVLGQRDSIDTPATRAGERFERHVLTAYAATLPEGSKVDRPEPTLRGHLRASPDAVVTVRGWPRLAEIKTTLFRSEWGSDGTDGIPLHYAVQGMWYLDLLGIDEADFPVLLWPHEMRDLLGLTPDEVVSACELRVLSMRYSPAMAQHLRQRVDEFWHRHVLAEVPPPSVDLEDAKRLVWAKAGATVEADEQVIDLMLRRDSVKADVKAREGELERIEHELRERIGTHEVVIHPKTRSPILTCKVINRAGYTAVVRPTSYRPLTTTKAWKEATKS